MHARVRVRYAIRVRATRDSPLGHFAQLWADSSTLDAHSLVVHLSGSTMILEP